MFKAVKLGFSEEELGEKISELCPFGYVFFSLVFRNEVGYVGIYVIA